MRMGHVVEMVFSVSPSSPLPPDGDAHTLPAEPPPV